MDLKVLPSSAHAAMDYALGAAALAAPRMFGFSRYSTPTLVSRGLGLYALASALSTKNGAGLFKALPWNTHLKMDAAMNTMAWAAPFILGFRTNKRASRTILALAAIQGLVWLLSKRH